MRLFVSSFPFVGGGSLEGRGWWSAVTGGMEGGASRLTGA